MQPEKLVAGWRRNDDLIFAANSADGICHTRPVGAGEVGILLQDVASGRRWPRDDRAIRAGEKNSQRRCAKCLHGEQAPETAGQRIIAAG